MRVLSVLLALTLAAPAVADERRLAVAGQSLAVQWVGGPAEQAFRDTRARLGDTDTWIVQRYAVGGTSALSELAPDSNPDYWWWNYSTGQPGPILQAQVAAIGALPPEERPTVFLWSQGQHDALFWSVRQPYGEAEFRKRYRSAVLSITRALRLAAAGPSYPTATVLYIEELGGRTPPRPGDEIVRQVQSEIVSLYGASHNIKLVPSPIDLPLKDGIHPTGEGDAVRGYFAGKSID